MQSWRLVWVSSAVTDSLSTAWSFHAAILWWKIQLGKSLVGHHREELSGGNKTERRNKKKSFSVCQRVFVSDWRKNWNETWSVQQKGVSESDFQQFWAIVSMCVYMCYKYACLWERCTHMGWQWWDGVSSQSPSDLISNKNHQLIKNVKQWLPAFFVRRIPRLQSDELKYRFINTSNYLPNVFIWIHFILDVIVLLII